MQVGLVLMALRADIQVPGLPGGQVTFLASPRQGNPKKATRPHRPFGLNLGFPGKSGGRVKLGLRPQTNAADCPRFTRKTEAAQRGKRVVGVLGRTRWKSPHLLQANKNGRLRGMCL
jgi:hypothetical protein